MIRGWVAPWATGRGTRSLTSMKTRTLLLLSVACGLAIIVAGGLKLFLVASDRAEVPVLAIGEQSTIGDMTVSVTSISETPDGTEVAIEMRGVEGAPVVDGWRLLGDGKVMEASGAVGDGVCGADTVVGADGVECTLRFPDVGAVQAVAYTRAGEQRQWAP